MAKQKKTIGLDRSTALNARPKALPVESSTPVGTGIELRIQTATRPWQQHILRMPKTVERRVQLDSVGSFVFSLCDGAHSVYKIAELVAKKYQLDEHQAEMSVAHFIKQLTQKGFVHLII